MARNGASRSVILAAAALVAAWPSAVRHAAAQVAADPSPHSDAFLVARSAAVVPGRSLMVGLRILLEPGWHTYWVNPGDSGTEALLTWRLPEGWSAGPIRWPRPHRIAYPPLMSYGYEGEVLLPVELSPRPTLADDTVVVAVTADWLVCQETCLPATDEVALRLPVWREDAPPPAGTWAPLFESVMRELPVEAAGWKAEARRTADGYLLELRPPPGGRIPTDAYFFPLDPTALDHAAPQPLARVDGGATLHLRSSPYNTDPDTLTGILVTDEAGGFGVPGERPALRVDAPVGPATAAPPPAAPSWAAALLLALAGGVLLNLMPCVFPVLSLKVVGFVEAGAGGRAEAVRHGLAFAAGVVASFAALGGALLALRRGGAAVGWGFQLQSPAVVALLVPLMVVVGLAFLGVFEVAPSLTRLGGLDAAGRGYAGSVLSGVLATAVATPCTAPFMGAAVGAAVVMPPLPALSVFILLGAGMAAPYVLLSSRPALLRRLPPPGRWMETLRQFMAFPMFAVAVWLVWVFARLTDADRTAWLLGCVVAVSFVAWWVGRGQTAARGGRRAWMRTGVTLAGVAAVALAGGRAASPARESSWRPYSAAALAELREEGRPVFVDFTAAWCISCQVNERLVLSRPTVLRGFAEAGIALLRADWTRRDPDITEALATFGRSGVPLYVLYPPGDGAPQVLPAVLTPSLVLDAVDQLREVVSEETP